MTKSPPMWVLIAHDHDDDTMFVVCHYHFQPDENEIREMSSSVDGHENLVFHVAFIK